MPIYIGLATWTQEGIQNVKDSPARLEKAKQIYRKEGGELKEFYVTMGGYDMVAITELPDDAAAARVALQLGAAGAIRTQTLRAFTEAEYQDIVASIS